MTDRSIVPDENPDAAIDRSGADTANATTDHLVDDVAAAGAASADAAPPRVQQESRWTVLRRMFRTAPLTAWFGMIVILLYVFTALFADLIAPFSETENPGRSFEPPGEVYWLGTDNLGRDMLSRMIYAARNTVGIAFVTTALAFMLGGLLGLLAAVFGGWTDNILSRIVDVLMAIPQLIFALLALTVLNSQLSTMEDVPSWAYTLGLILIIAVLDSTRVYRLTRAVAMNIVVMDYVEAARLRGEGTWWLIRKEILPNATAPLIAEFGLRFCFVFLTISALSFLGLGIQPPLADWGSMVRANADMIGFANIDPTVAIYPMLPAAAIALLTVSVNFVVDWMLHRSSGLKE